MTTTPTRISAHVLSKTLEQLSEADSLEQVTGPVATAVRRLMGADGATFVLREDDQCFYADEDAIGPMWKGKRFPMTACISGWSMLHSQVVSISDIYADERIPHDAYRPTFVKSLTMVPIRPAAPIGAIGAYWRDEHRPTAGQIRQLEVLANSTAVALENLELRGAVARRQSERDGLELAIHALAHDLRNPVVAMMGYAEMIEADAESAPELVQSHARTIIAAGHRLAGQIDKLLNLYRVIDKPIERVRVDLTAIARDVADQLRVQLRGRTVRIDVEDGLVAHADPELIRTVLENLLGNAVKYSARREDARVELTRLPDPAGTAGPDSTDAFAVRDNGIGFDPADAHRLFRPGGRLHRDAEFTGTGLGLASVARIIELHGGAVRATSRPGEGSVFSFFLPVPDQP